MLGALRVREKRTLAHALNCFCKDFQGTVLIFRIRPAASVECAGFEWREARSLLSFGHTHWLSPFIAGETTPGRSATRLPAPSHKCAAAMTTTVPSAKPVPSPAGGPRGCGGRGPWPIWLASRLLIPPLDQASATRSSWRVLCAPPSTADVVRAGFGFPARNRWLLNLSHRVTTIRPLRCRFDSLGQVSNKPTGNFVFVDVGYDHSCALDNTGALSCWGPSGRGKRGPRPILFGLVFRFSGRGVLRVATSAAGCFEVFDFLVHWEAPMSQVRTKLRERASGPLRGDVLRLGLHDMRENRRGGLTKEAVKLSDATVGLALGLHMHHPCRNSF